MVFWLNTVTIRPPVASANVTRFAWVVWELIRTSTSASSVPNVDCSLRLAKAAPAAGSTWSPKAPTCAAAGVTVTGPAWEGQPARSPDSNVSSRAMECDIATSGAEGALT